MLCRRKIIKRRIDLKNNVILIGFMATGKSTIGRRLAEKLNMNFADTDQMIEQIHGKSIDTIFREHGEEFFRREESNIVALVARKTGQVIATGGGAVLRAENHDMLAKSGFVICLQAAPEVIAARAGSPERPLLAAAADRMAHIKKLLQERSACYSKADFMVDTGKVDIDAAVEKIAQFLAEHDFTGGSNG